MRPHFLVERDEENRLAAFHEEKAAPPSGEAVDGSGPTLNNRIPSAPTPVSPHPAVVNRLRIYLLIKLVVDLNVVRRVYYHAPTVR